MICAHNFAQYYAINNEASAPKLVFEVQCEERCILYTARFTGSTRHDLALAVGTVFNQILIWHPFGALLPNGDAPVYRRLVGHEGVLFNLRWNADRSKLTSVSDDRTIRVWNANDETYTSCLNLTVQGTAKGVFRACFSGLGRSAVRRRVGPECLGGRNVSSVVSGAQHLSGLLGKPSRQIHLDPGFASKRKISGTPLHFVLTL